jgi:hypothetical protein
MMGKGYESRFEIGSGAVIYIPGLIKIGSAV